jgi:peptide/nickel transport system permease protein
MPALSWREPTDERAIQGLEPLAKQDMDKQESYFRSVSRQFMKHKMAVAGLLVFALLLIMACFAPLLAPYDPSVIQDEFSAAPSGKYWLGTDQVGRDVLSRLIYASRISLSIGLGSVAIYVAIGTVVGAIAGYYGGKVDMIINRVIDVFMSFPHLMVILVLVTIIGPGLSNIVLVLGLLGWPSVARLVRGSVLSIKQMEFVKAAQALGLSKRQIIFHEILPNAMSPLLVNATFGAATAILSESSLSFLGMGVQPPTASWGNMLTAAQSITTLQSEPWLWIPAGLMIVFTVLAINFVGDGVRDALDPKRK